MDLDFQLNVLDFEKIFNSIDTNEKLSVVMLVNSNPEQTEFDVLDKTPTEIQLEEVSSKKQITWKKDEFISNKYNILDLHRDAAMELPETIIKTSFEELEPQFVNYESVYIQKNDYEQIFPIPDQIDAINQYYLSRIENPSNYARTIIQKKADVLGSFIQNFNHIPKSTDIPILDQMKENHFYSPLLRPIVYDSKYIFKESAMFDQEDVRNYFREDEDKLIITLIEQITDEYRKKGNDKLMKYTEFQNALIYGGDLPFAIKLGPTSIQHVKPLMSSYLPMNKLAEHRITETVGLSRSELEDKIQKVAGFSLNTTDFTDVYRFITPTYPFGPANIVQTSVRRTQGSKMILHDRPDQTEIGKKQGSRECSGTARTSESQYFSKADPYVPTSIDGIRNQFNKCISKEPTQIPATDGEEIFVVGMFLKSPFSITPPNNILNKKKNNSMLPIDYFIENRNGWWNVMDRVIQGRTVARQNQNKLPNELSMHDEPNFNEDNIILFETETFRSLSKEEFNAKLRQIIPSTNKILQIEDDNLKTVNNITDLNKILSKYFLSHKNLNVKQMDQMERFLQNAYFKYKTNSEQEKRDVSYFKSLNAYCHQLFHSVYESICRLQLQSNINEEDICAFIETHFQSFDMHHVSHILKFYYGLDTAAYLDKSKMMSILVHLFSRRYSDYMQSDSPVRLLLLPNFYIEDAVIQKYADFIRRFYHFDELSHAPSSIGLINELYHRMFIRDSSMHFNYFAEFVYAATGYNKIVHDEAELFQMYPSADAVQQQIAQIDLAIYQQKITFQTQEMVCSKYELSKFYSNKIDLLNDNNKDDIRVDKIFDKTATLNSIYAIHGANSGSYIKQAYPNEPAEWHDSILEILLDKNGKLTGASVEDSMWALLVDANSYDLYQRNNNVWEFRLSVPEIARVEVPYNKKTKQFSPPKNISALCNLEGRDASVVDKIADFIFFGLKQTQNDQENEKNRDGKCVAYENSCYAKVVLQLNKKRMELQSIVKAFTYYQKQKQIYSAKAFDRRQLMEVLLQQYERAERAKLAKKVVDSASGRDTVLEEKKTNAFAKQWNLIVQIPEIDVRYDEMNKFIQTYGMLEKRVDKASNRLIDSAADWTNIYFNNTETPEILCCKHYLYLVKQAWQSNDVRHELQEILENLFKGDDSNEAVIFCKYCGENIGRARESDFEGFDDSEHAIVLREAVAEQSDEHLPILAHEVQTEMYDKILVELMHTLQFQLKAKDITEIMRNAGDIYVKSKPNIYAFEIKMSGQMKPESAYRKARDVVKGQLNDEILKSHPDIGRLFDQQIRVLHNRFLAKLMVDTVIFQLMLHLLIVDPEIKLNPIGSRFSECRISVINNCVLNVEAFFTMFAQVIHCIAKAATDPANIFTVYRAFFSQALFNVDHFKNTFSEKFKEHLDKNESYKHKFESKQAKYAAEFEITKQLVLDSAVWKSFRPILKLGMPDAELAKIDLQSIRAEVSSTENVLSGTKIQYAAFQLSNYLFYSIQQVIQEQSTLMAGQSFSNYCCIQPLRTKYLEYFVQQNARIQECIEIMRLIEPQSFYNPNQSSWLICGGSDATNMVIENKCPLLLDYFQEAQNLLGDQNQLKHRIRTLYKTYCLGPNETGQRRLYSQLYDEYLGMVNITSSQAITQRIQDEHPELKGIDIQFRVLNLYSETDPGLIRKDIITDKYSWTIQQEAEDKIEENYGKLLQLYESLVLSLNLSSNLKIANESFNPLHLKQRYDSESIIKREQLIELKHIFNELASAIRENNGQPIFSELFDLNTRLQSVVDPDADLTDIFAIMDKQEYISIDIDQPRLVINFNDIGNCTAIIDEKLHKLSSFIQIEGYSQEQIESQLETRSAIARHEDELKNFENLKQYYLFVMETISKFVNYTLNNKFVMHSVNRHKELSENVNQSRKINFNLNQQKFVDYVAMNPEYTNLRKEQLQTMGICIPFKNIQNLGMPLQTSKILNPMYLNLVIYYLLHKTLNNFVETAPNRAFAVDYIKKFIQEESFEEFNCLTEEKVKNHLRDLIKKQNARRKKQVDEINKDESMRMQYKLIRDLNLGNILGQEMKELSAVSNEVAEAQPVIEAAPAAEGAADDISASEVAANPRDRPDDLRIGKRVNGDTDEAGNDDVFGDQNDYGDD
jgi:hypothetical protein